MPRDKDDYSAMPESTGLEDFKALDKLLADNDSGDGDSESDPLDDPNFFEDDSPEDTPDERA